MVSAGKTTYACPNGHGVKFYTPFQDGTLLVSKTYADDTSNRPMIVKFGLANSISGTWAEHQRRIQSLEAEGKRVMCQTGFQAAVCSRCMLPLPVWALIGPRMLEPSIVPLPVCASTFPLMASSWMCPKPA